jgi:hypothetical protein
LASEALLALRKPEHCLSVVRITGGTNAEDRNLWLGRVRVAVLDRHSEHSDLIVGRVGAAWSRRPKEGVELLSSGRFEPAYNRH